MGEVYLAQDTELNRKVAIKFLPANADISEQTASRFIREARTAARLDHPNICSILEVGEEAGRSFIVMQYIDGETLAARIIRKPPSLIESLNFATQIAEALSEAHAQGVIHRDIKPANLMVTARGALKVMDFGLAKLLSHADEIQTEAETEKLISTPGTILGTLVYMSPEQVRGEALDERSDIFSFGVLLYEMLTGQRPFAGKSSAATASAILTHEPLPVARFALEVPAELERIVGKALRKDKEDRYQTAKDLLIDLRTLKDELEFQQKVERSTPPDATSGRVVSDGRTEAAVVSSQATVAVTAVNQPSTRERSLASSVPSLKKRIPPMFWILAVAVVLLAAAAGWFGWSRANVRWARAQVARIEQLAQDQNYLAAYQLATAVQKYLPDEPTITRLMPTISQTISVRTDPAGAQIYLKSFSPDEAGDFPNRQLLGTSPLNNLRVGRGQYILYIEKDGFAKIERTLSGATLHAGSYVVLPPPTSIEQKLLPVDRVPDKMCFVPGGDYRLVAWARPTDARPHLNDFFIDKYEVSNQDFKEFINAGGYLKKQFWKYPFLKDGRTLSWEDAMKEFKDHTGLPGPRSWSSQNFPEGKADYPVVDITWYEAAAFAEFKGKQLPTIFQWEKTARNEQVTALANIMPWGVFYPGQTLEHRANFGSNGTMPVSSSEFGMSPFGAYNMAGNVSEWCLNETPQGFIAAGGAWGEPTYMFAYYGFFPGFFSSEKRGFRCARNINDTADQSAMRIEIKEEIPTYTPSSEATFNDLAKYYHYEKTPLDPQIVETKDTDVWRREKITFNGADGERAIAYLYLPKNVSGPLQVIHFVPPADVESGARPLPQAMEDTLGPVVKSGRAVFGVVIKGYVERLRPEGYTAPDPTTVEYRDKIVNLITDLRRGLDYLETRKDLDANRIGFFGPSSGARIGLILAAVENRYRSVFLMGAGVRKPYAEWIPEGRPQNFAAHIRAPKLMMHGRYDENLSLKTEAEPLFKLLPEPKRLVLYEGGHVPPLELLVTTLNSWLDETLGPVRRE